MSNIIIKIADIFLETEESSFDWKKDKSIMISWYILFFLVLIVILYKGLINLLMPQLSNSIKLTYIFRIGNLSLATFMIFALGHLTFRFYRFIIYANNRIYFINIIYFYIMSILLFSYAYNLLNQINSEFFISTIDLPVHSETYVNHGLMRFLTGLKFMLYSALQSVTGNFNGINSNSVIVSIYNYLQNIYTISLLSLLISTFVSRNSNKHSDKHNNVA